LVWWCSWPPLWGQPSGPLPCVPLPGRVGLFGLRARRWGVPFRAARRPGSRRWSARASLAVVAVCARLPPASPPRLAAPLVRRLLPLAGSGRLRARRPGFGGPPALLARRAPARGVARVAAAVPPLRRSARSALRSAVVCALRCPPALPVGPSRWVGRGSSIPRGLRGLAAPVVARRAPAGGAGAGRWVWPCRSLLVLVVGARRRIIPAIGGQMGNDLPPHSRGKSKLS
jgi:hypothetical protein